MNLRVRALKQSDAERLFQLRLACYRASRDFTLLGDERCLAWSEEDAAAIVLGVFTDPGKLVATMRGQMLLDRAGLSLQTALAADMPYLFPTFYLSRAATHPEWARAGLNALLRVQLLRFAMDHGLRSLTGMVTDRAERTGTLREMGYRFYGGCAEDEGLRAERGPWRLVVLDLARDGQRALDHLLGVEMVGARESNVN